MHLNTGHVQFYKYLTKLKKQCEINIISNIIFNKLFPIKVPLPFINKVAWFKQLDNFFPSFGAQRFLF